MAREDEWEKTQGQTMNVVPRPNQESYRKKRTILGEDRRNAGMDR
jgi:hypothetical protein